MEELISIITPCFNNARNIGDTIKSVISQSYKHWELICVDDGSTDNTCSIIEGFQKQCDRIKLIHRQRNPKGGSVCRNIGLENSKGEYVLYLDADDVLHPDCLKNRLNKIEGTQYDFVVFPNAILRDGKESRIGIDSRINKHFLAFSSNHAVWQTSCPLYRKSFVNHVGGFDEAFPRLQDVEFGTRCLANSKGNYRFFFKGYNPDCYYRLSDNSKVFTKKYDLAFNTIPQLYNLIINLESKGFYKKKEMSKVILCLILSTIMISQATTLQQSYRLVFPNSYSMYLRSSDKIKLWLVERVKKFPWLYGKMAHIIRYLTFRLYY